MHIFCNSLQKVIHGNEIEWLKEATAYSINASELSYVFFLSSLQNMRAKVWRARTISSLFNTEAYAHGMEQVYTKIWEKYSKGEPFDHITEL